MPSSIDLVERMYDAFARGDLDAMAGAAAPDVVLLQDPALPWGGRYVGTKGISEFFTKLVGTSATGITTDALFAAGEHVVQYGRSRGTVRHNGATYDTPECHVWTAVDGTVTEVRFYIDSTTMLEVLSR